MKKILLSIVALLSTVYVMAQEQFYVVMKDGSVESYPVEKVDSLTFEKIDADKIMGFSDLMREIDALNKKVDSLAALVANCCCRDTVSTDTIISHPYVDLGLESGSLWATYNIGASVPEEYGDYFTWGETEAATVDYDTMNYKWRLVEYDTLKVKGVIDANDNLTSGYDAATVNWGDEWRMPTNEEILELVALENEEFELNGVNGRLFHGTNGNTLFIPYAGYRISSGLTRNDEYGTCWSATTAKYVGYYGSAYKLHAESSKVGSNAFYGCAYARSIRPVLKTK